MGRRWEKERAFARTRSVGALERGWAMRRACRHLEVFSSRLKNKQKHSTRTRRDLSQPDETQTKLGNECTQRKQLQETDKQM